MNEGLDLQGLSQLVSALRDGVDGRILPQELAKQILLDYLRAKNLLTVKEPVKKEEVK